MTDVLQVTTTTDSRDAALTLAGGAVQLKLASSAQVSGPVTAIFWHLGEFGTGDEWRANFKTTKDRYPELEAFLIANHPWQNPQVTAVSIEAGSADYLAWVQRATTDS